MNTPFLDFKPAEVKRNKEVYVSFHVLDPTNEKLKRIRIRCNRIKNRKKQERYASRICLEINRKLYEGWNPLTGENPAAKKKVSLTESAIRYVRAKEKVLRKDSARSYRTKLTFFVKWCEKEKIANWLCGRFSTEYAAKLLDDYGSNERSAYSYNSMLQFLKGMFKWFLSEGLVKNNPFELFKGKRKEDKRRVTIPKQDRIRILNYFHKRGMTEYVAAIRLCFKYLIRPKEILMLQIKDLNFDNNMLRIPPNVSKNHKERIIALGYDVMKYFQTLQMYEYPQDLYIFSTNFKPGERLYTTKNLFSVWQKMRERLSMPETYHFYSLKDTGITEMLESGMPSKYVKDLAGHQSLAMTERYLHISDAKRILQATKIKF